MAQENNPLGLKDKKYTEKEFALAIRNKFETNDFLPDQVLVNIFLDKYPIYSCKVKRSENNGGCSCC
ncbi:MAG: hypothetical protein CMD29_04230 [Flavobacteriales bacterium]|nr:hypothetical protein [Flavobacteriales bacterium]